MRRSTADPPDLPGYTYIQLLGSGGFSDVFLYEQKLPKRRVAVKVMLTEHLSTASRAAFVAEANLMAQLSAHPYIVTIFHADVAGDDRPYFVMEYCSGPSLSERYKLEQFPVADALRTGVRLSSAIATAHAAGILHRDIKPANVLTNDYGWPALTDFGISSAVDDEVLPLHTGTLAEALAHSGGGSGGDEGGGGSGGTDGASVGMSVPWSPPEMFDDDPHPDIRSDVFSLAATIYTIIAGHTPFEVRGRSNGTLDLINRIERGEVAPIARDDVTRSLNAVLAKGMAPKRADRFDTVIDFARALQRVELEIGYTPTTIDVPLLGGSGPDRSTGADDDDATRARGISTVEAQPPMAVPGSEPTVARAPMRIRAQPGRPDTPGTDMQGADVGKSSGDDTVRRPRVAAAAFTSPPVASAPIAPAPVASLPTAPAPIAPAPIAQPSTGTEATRGDAAHDENEVAEPRQRSRPRTLAAIVAGVAAVLIAAAVAVGIVITAGQTSFEASAQPSDDDSSDGGQAVGESIPTPTLTGESVEGSSVVFTVVNPEPVEGDAFTWRRLYGAQDEPVKRVPEGTISVDGYIAGQSVCIEVSVLRSGRQSADPLQACYPE